MSEPAGKTLVLEDRQIAGMVADPRIVAAVPCLAGPQQTLRSVAPGGINCGRCHRKKRDLHQNAVQQAKICIANLSPDKRTELKRLLNVARIQIIILARGGRREIRML